MEKITRYNAQTVPESQVLARYITSFSLYGEIRAGCIQLWNLLLHRNREVRISRSNEGVGIKFKIYYNLKPKNTKS